MTYGLTEFEYTFYNAMLNEFDHFAKIAGLNINYSKTEVLRIGSLRSTDAQFYSRLPLHWSDGPVTILGIDITGDWITTAQINYEKTLKKVESTFKIWSKRSLTVLGKI